MRRQKKAEKSSLDKYKTTTRILLPHTKIFPTAQIAVETLSYYLMGMVRHAQQPLNIAICGGNTPKLWFYYLSKNCSDRLDWGKICWFWVDERCVPIYNPESNFGIANELIFRKMNIPPENIHRIYGENDFVAEAARYQNEILQYVPIRNGLPQFDLVVLGLGEDGHVGSLFPWRINHFESSDLCLATQHPKTGQKRVTLTFKILNHSQQIIFLVTGSNKTDIVKKISNLRGQIDPNYPATYIRRERVKWLMDEAAAENKKD